MPPLHPSQFAGLASRLNAPNGGFTVSTTSGKEPKSGIMVAQAGGERKQNIPSAATDLQNYANRFSQPLAAPGAHFGGWHPGTDPTADLDVSQRFPNRRRSAAMKEMVMNKQKAAYHIDTGNDIDNAVHPANVSTAGMTHKQAKAHVAATRAAQSVFAEGYRKQAGRSSYRAESRRLRAM